MASKTQPSSSIAYSYIDFEPYCERKEEEGVETLIVHLPSFKKDQLRVQLSNQGVLRLTGERPVTGDGTRRSCFHKETKIPQECDITSIRAKFVNNQLQVIMPKRPPTARTQDQQQQEQPLSAVQRALKSQDNENPKGVAMVSNDQGLKTSNTIAENDKMGTMTSYGMLKDHMFGLRRSLARLQNDKKVGVGFGIAMVVMVTIGAYVAHKCGSNSSCSCIEVSGLN